LLADASVCCSAELVPFGPRLQYHYAECSRCGTLQLSPMPSAEAIERAYEWEYAGAKHTDEFSNPEWWERVSRPYRQSVVRALVDYRARGTIVDCGCGWGHLVETLRQSGFDARGVDLSRDEISYAQLKGLPVQRGTLSDLHELEGRVSAITMLGVFEHLIDHDSLLAQAHRLLCEGGLLVTLHPTATLFRLLATALRLGDRRRQLPDLFGAFTVPWHTVLFSIAGTRRVFERRGFQLVDIRPAPQGRLPGAQGFTQRVLEVANKVGWALTGTHWPLVTTHVFVFRKGSSAAAG